MQAQYLPAPQQLAIAVPMVDANAAAVSAMYQMEVQEKAGRSCCLWWTTILLSATMFIWSIVVGTRSGFNCSGFDDPTTNSNFTFRCAILKPYLFAIIIAPILIILGVISLRALKHSGCTIGKIPSEYNGSHLHVTWHLGWIAGSILFGWGLVYLVGFFWLVVFAPLMFIPCLIGVVLGVAQWVNCCCAQNAVVGYSNATVHLSQPQMILAQPQPSYITTYAPQYVAAPMPQRQQPAPPPYSV